jgi:hypothetical protein
VNDGFLQRRNCLSCRLCGHDESGAGLKQDGIGGVEAQ